MKPGLVILDRDGVINRDSKSFVKSVAEWQPLPGSLEAIGMLTRAGIPVAVASNQSGIGRGLFSRDTLYAMHRKLRRLAREHGGEIGRILYCPHLPDAGCDCRKPAPGMINNLVSLYGVEQQRVIVVGDSVRDLDAAAAAGAEPVLVLTGNGSRSAIELHDRQQKVSAFDDLLAFAKYVTASG
ncbi:MAG: D-glycero-beta-D-manno-heptose 1,7-bisphosphate 7-phosphatase [Woeseia sp.]